MSFHGVGKRDASIGNQRGNCSDLCEGQVPFAEKTKHTQILVDQAS